MKTLAPSAKFSSRETVSLLHDHQAYLEEKLECYVVPLWIALLVFSMNRASYSTVTQNNSRVSISFSLEFFSHTLHWCVTKFSLKVDSEQEKVHSASVWFNSINPVFPKVSDKTSIIGDNYIFF